MNDQEKPSFREGKKVKKSILAYDQKLLSASNAQSRLVSPIIDLNEKLRQEIINETLSAMSVDELSKAKLGIRIQALKDAGIYTIGQLKKIPNNRLEGIRGIGQKSAAGIVYYLNQIEKSVKDTAKVRININKKSKTEDNLVRNLFLFQKLKSSCDAAKKQYGDSHDNIERLLKKTLPARSWFIWSLTSEEKREVALQNLSFLKQMLEESYSKNANAIFAEQQNILKTEHDDYWGDFKRQSASYYATLERIKNHSFDENRNTINDSQQHLIQNGLPDELAVAISHVQLNLNGLKKELRDYQRIGVQYILNQGTVLLGDEMGLGKTAQAIATMVCLSNSGGTHFLVVCPASVLINWQREIEEWSNFSCSIIHGDNAFARIGEWQEYGGVGITTYETLSKLALPADFKYDLLVADEAHYVKNPKAARTRNLVYFRQHTSRALFMTGTALENRVEEMCILIGYLQPQIAQTAYRYTSIGNAGEFRRIIAPVYFRRTKEDVLDELPEKIETEEWCKIEPAEITMYKQFVAESSFNRMRQVSWLIDSPCESSKGKRLLAIIEEAVENNRKVIVFSFFLNTIEQVGNILSVPTFGPISGSVSPEKRQDIIDEFTNIDSGAVLLAQIQAGGTGLNIQAASVIIFCEPQLKPSIENQAVARAYRMGQVNTVMVYRLLCSRTVDERLLNLVKSKQKLFDEFADKSVSGQNSLLSSDDIKNMIEAERVEWGVVD